MVLGYHIFAAVHKFFEVKCVRRLVENPTTRTYIKIAQGAWCLTVLASIAQGT